MGIKIELTDDEIIEPSGGIVMFNLPGGEFPGNEDVLFDLRWSVIPRREGGIEVFGGNDGKNSPGIGRRGKGSVRSYDTSN